MWELDYKESWVPKNWCFWTVVLEKTLEGSLDSKVIKPVNPRGNQSWTFIERTDAEAEAPIHWTPDTKNWLIRKDSDAGKDWKQKRMTEDEMVGWHHRFNGHEFKQAPGVGDGQGSLACCSPWVAKSQTWLSDWTEQKWHQNLNLRLLLKHWRSENPKPILPQSKNYSLGSPKIPKAKYQLSFWFC